MAEIIQHGGKPAVYLSDHRGKRHLYLFRVEVDGTTTRYVFEKLGDLADPVYTVTHRPGSWRCTCDAWKYSRGLVKDCKHVTCSRSVEAFLAALTPA